MLHAVLPRAPGEAGSGELDASYLVNQCHDTWENRDNNAARASPIYEPVTAISEHVTLLTPLCGRTWLQFSLYRWELQHRQTKGLAQGHAGRQ